MKRTELNIGEVAVSGLNNVNVVLGRNGSGKSRMLRAIDEGLANDQSFNVRYISPERAGVFRRDGNSLNNMERDPNWLKNVRRVNQAEGFKSSSANLLREIETAYLRRMQTDFSVRDDHDRNFHTDRLDHINRLLSNLTIEQERSEFIFRSVTGEVVQPDQISSGESESVALATEIMYFFETLATDKFNLLLLDEPDVHLHPDLQGRMANFIMAQLAGLDDKQSENIAVLVATHSTPLVCALATSERVSVGAKDFGVSSVHFNVLKDQIRKIAPFFGHPLSLSLSNDVMLILEGEDDERVWQQAARSSQGRIRLFPVLSSSVDVQSELEQFCAPLLESLYDSPIAYSIRDGDGISEDIEPIGCIERYRLHCYSIENALVTDECLAVLGTTWPNFQTAAREWINKNETRPEGELLRQLIQAEDRLKDTKIKNIRQLICAIAATNKPWEVVVGQAIGSLDVKNFALENSSIASFLGVRAVQALLTPQATA